jgi:hypothetical protein
MVGQALLMIVARTLTNQTAAAAVVEQPVEPIVEVMKRSGGSGQPVIAVYVESSENAPVGLETQSGEAETVLKVIAYTPPSWRVGEDGIVFENEGTALGLNILGRQIDRALHYGNATWVSLFRGFAKHVETRKTRYLLIELEDGIRIPAIEIAYSFKRTVQEPEIGVPLFGQWLLLDTALRAEGETAVADMLKSLIESPAGLVPWQQYQMARNLSDAAFMSTGSSPVMLDGEYVVDEETGEPPLLEEVDAEPDQIDIIAPGLPPS